MQWSFGIHDEQAQTIMVAPFWAACDPRHATIIYHSMPQAVEGYFFWMHNVRFGCTFHFFFQFSATEWTVTTRALAVSNSLACIHMLILVHQQECMVGYCNAWTVSYCTLMDYATVSYWYICMSLTTSPLFGVPLAARLGSIPLHSSHD